VNCEYEFKIHDHYSYHQSYLTLNSSSVNNGAFQYVLFRSALACPEITNVYVLVGVPYQVSYVQA
jgi:hypothetical protein